MLGASGQEREGTGPCASCQYQCETSDVELSGRLKKPVPLGTMRRQSFRTAGQPNSAILASSGVVATPFRTTLTPDVVPPLFCLWTSLSRKSVSVDGNTLVRADGPEVRVRFGSVADGGQSSGRGRYTGLQSQTGRKCFR